MELSFKNINIEAIYFLQKVESYSQNITSMRILLYFFFFLFINFQAINAQTIVRKELLINNSPTYLNISNFRNNNYLHHSEFARILNLKTEIKDGRLALSSSKYQMIFLRGSSFILVKHSGKEEIKQMNIPVIEINNVLYLPYPTSLTLLDTIGLISVQIEKQHRISPKHITKSETEIQIDEDLIIPENITEITNIHNSIKNRPANLITTKQKNIPINEKEGQNLNKVNPDKTVSPNKKPILTIATTPKPEDNHFVEGPKSKDIEEVKVSEININDSKNNINQSKSVIEGIENDLHSIKNESSDPIYNGYKIPSDLKRKRLQKLLGHDGI